MFFVSLQKEAPVAKQQKAPIRIPKDINEADEFLRLIQELELENQKNQEECEAAVHVVEQQYLLGFQKNLDLMEQYAKGLFEYASEHRAELTEDGKKKTVELPSGKFLWRYTPPRVSIKDVKKVLEELVRRRLRGFIRRTPSINKEAMLKRPEAATAVPGVSITQVEEFVIKPNEVLAEVTAAAAGKKKITVAVNDLRPKPEKENKKASKKQAG